MAKPGSLSKIPASIIVFKYNIRKNVSLDRVNSAKAKIMINELSK